MQFLRFEVGLKENSDPKKIGALVLSGSLGHETCLHSTTSALLNIQFSSQVI